MDVIDAIKERKSIRAFKSDPVKLDLLKKIIEQAQRAPSWANSQPWEFIIVTGEKLKAIQDGFVERGGKGMQNAKPEVTHPYNFPEPYISRIRSMQAQEGRGRAKEMAPPDFEAAFARNARHYGAPCCIYLLINKNFIYQEKGVNVWPMYDSGAVVQNIMLLAVNYGLGTIPQAMAVVYPDIIRKELGIAEDKAIALGIAIGYPDWDSPANKDLRGRVPLDEIAKFYGF
jgi:nitroreductase